jgi:hypothetical protein
MSESLPFQLLADAVLILHAALVLFVVSGLILVLIGNFLKWRWVNLLWFRLMHLATIAFITVEAWLGLVCPLTTLEMWLRLKAKAVTYEGSFVEHWLQALLFWQAPAWMFTAIYTAFALAVAGAWWCFPPKSRRDERATDA